MIWLRCVIVLLALFSLELSGSTSISTGEVCPGEMVTINCTYNSSTMLVWMYDRTQVPFPQNMPVGEDVTYTSAATTTAPPITVTYYAGNDAFSGLSFIADRTLHGDMVLCIRSLPIQETLSYVVYVAMNDFPPVTTINVLVVVNGKNSTTLTIEWFVTNATRLPTIQLLPHPILPFSVIRNNSTFFSASITVLYNTTYIFTVTSSNCAGTNITELTILRGLCNIPPSAPGVMILPYEDTLEGSSIVFRCVSGDDSENKTSTCTRSESEFLWIPDPGSHNCTDVTCVVPSSVNDFVEVDANDTYMIGSMVSLWCQRGLNTSEVMNATCTSNGTWNPKLQLFSCNEIPTLTSRTTDSRTTTASKTKTGSKTITGVIAGVVGSVIILIAIVLLLGVILLLFRRQKYSEKETRKKCSKNDSDAQELQLAEYALTTHNLKDSNITLKANEVIYNQLEHGTSKTNFGKDDEYSSIPGEGRSRNRHDIQLSSGQQYSILHTTDEAGLHPSKHSGVTYADLGINHHGNKISNPTLDSKVVYSDVTCSINENENSADESLDLNMLLIQVAEVEQLWHSYGEALGVPIDVLAEVSQMKCGNHDKLVEVLDYWFYMHSKNVPPTWHEVSKGLEIIGCSKIAADIMEVYTTGHLPIAVDDTIPVISRVSTELPPPIPPKSEISVVQTKTAFSSTTSSIQGIPPKFLPTIPARPPKKVPVAVPGIVPPPRPPKLQ